MNSSTPLITYGWITKERYWLSCAVSPVLVLVGGAFLSMPHVGWQLAGGAVCFMGLLMLIQIQTVFDKSRGLLCVHHRLFGHLPVWTQTFRLDEFDAVVVERHESYHPSWPRAESENYFISYRIGLRRKMGRRFWIRHDSFSSLESSRRAEEFAWRLSCDTGLETIETEV